LGGAKAKEAEEEHAAIAEKAKSWCKAKEAAEIAKKAGKECKGGVLKI